MRHFRPDRYNGSYESDPIYCTAFFSRKSLKMSRNNNCPIFKAAINVLTNRAPIKGIFFLVCNARVIKSMEKPRKNKIPRVDAFWGGGWKGNDLLNFNALLFCHSLKTLF